MEEKNLSEYKQQVDKLGKALLDVIASVSLGDFNVNLDIPDDDYERARKNINSEQLREIASIYPMDGSMNYRRSMQAHQDRLYYIGQTQPITILNPFAWAQFIKAWKDGKFKRKKNRESLKSFWLRLRG